MEKAIRLVNSRGDSLDSLLRLGNKKRLIILCHGFGGCKDDFGIKQLSLSLNKHGYPTFTFDFTGQGKSEGDSEFDLKQQVSDLEVVMDHFKKTYPLITLLGGSMGGLISALTAIKRTDITNIILVNPFLYLFKRVSWRDTKYLIGTILLYPFNKRVRSIYSTYFAYFQPKKLETPTLIVTGKNDARVSPIHSHQFFNDIGCEKKLIEDGEIDHELSKQHYVDIVTKYIINWLQAK